MSESRRPLTSRILLVEDEGLVAMLAEDLLAEAGHDVVLAMRLDQALKFVCSENFDFAVLDVNLGAGVSSYPVARLLIERGIPFVFASGYGSQAVLEEFSKYEVVRKPYSSITFLEAVAKGIDKKSLG